MGCCSSHAATSSSVVGPAPATQSASGQPEARNTINETLEVAKEPPQVVEKIPSARKDPDGLPDDPLVAIGDEELAGAQNDTPVTAGDQGAVEAAGEAAPPCSGPGSADVEAAQPLLTHEHERPETDRTRQDYRGDDKSTFPTLLGWPFYPLPALDVANRVHPKKVSASWCVGPIMKLSMCMPLVYTSLAFGVATASAMLSTCVGNRNELTWPVWLWWIWAPVGIALLAVECHILKHLSVPYYFKAKCWGSPPTLVINAVFGRCCPTRWSTFQNEHGTVHKFPVWFLWCLFTSIVRMFSFFTANMFIGMVIGDLRSWNTCSRGRAEYIWHVSLERSRYWMLESETSLCSIFIVMFSAQIVHFLFGLLHALPRWNQWSTKGRKPAEVVSYGASPTYEQDFEREIIEFVSWRKPMERRNPTERSRPNGTRFVYITLGGNEVTSSQAVEIIGEACGMSGIEKTQDVLFGEYQKAVDEMNKADQTADHGDVREALVKVRGLVRDARMFLRTMLSHIFLYGFLLSGISLQAQVTYFNARCFVVGEGGNISVDNTCHDGSGLWIGVLSGFLTVGLTTYKIYKTMKYAFHVREVCRQYDDWYLTRAGFIRNDHDELLTKHEQIMATRQGLWFYGLALFLAAGVFLINFAWVVAKWTMATFFCQDKIWNVAFPPMDGCVELNDTI